MRIIGGKHKGRRFEPPRNNPARPTTDIAKEALFNIIGNYFNFDRIAFLDLFGGTGSLSFEMASRDCPDITLVERFQPNIAFIKKTSDLLQLSINIVKGDVYQYINSAAAYRYDIIFAGPPYADAKLKTLPELVLENKLLTKPGWFILEHSPRHHFINHPHLFQSRHYGQTNFSIFTYETKAE